MPKVRSFTATVSYRDKAGAEREETFPIQALDYRTATSLAFAYALQVLKLPDFELRIAGA
jgi:hypothetical protein